MSSKSYFAKHREREREGEFLASSEHSHKQTASSFSLSLSMCDECANEMVTKYDRKGYMKSELEHYTCV